MRIFEKYLFSSGVATAGALSGSLHIGWFFSSARRIGDPIRAFSGDGFHYGSVHDAS